MCHTPEVLVEHPRRRAARRQQYNCRNIRDRNAADEWTRGPIGS
jgi:hypothetical protein